MWLHEIKLELIGCNDRVLRLEEDWRSFNRCVVSTVKHGVDYIMLYDCFAASGAREMTMVERNMSSEPYKDIFVRQIVCMLKNLQ